MVSITESGVNFGYFSEEDLYKIEHSQGHLSLGEGFKMSKLLSYEKRGTLEMFCNKHRRLMSKVHKLKRENLILSDRRKSILIKNLIKSKDILDLQSISEKIGSKGLKIRQLRTKIQKLKSDYLRYEKIDQ